MSAPTPGKWHEKFDPQSGRWEVWAGSVCVCRVKQGSRDDVRLMVAGPELLRALYLVRDVESLSRENGEPKISDDQLAEIDAAITRATHP